MRASTILAVAGSTLVAAAPAATTYKTAGNTFEVTNFIFGCTNECDWYFDVKVTGDHAPTHPAITTPVHCQGSFTGAKPETGKDYIQCAATGKENSQLLAYIDRETSQLNLQYVVSIPEQTATYRYYGETQVYSATGSNASKQKKNFTVKQSRATAVA
ncbi:uncharacterized protein K489DRAFT_380732 [Dissoconium aciculare CBS 342.82]|jgi:hypothetical protein|uniref:Hypersensitive response-inducing protein n=1 Tax=Dissoconium aciculare CBS 342.82 TaxID=1314786 RepID=A0A6J3M1U1_9PEZI|nr:uncharacterized protein K489DRAFT_380732 [Dissoconium aciculare CBS 342.82]KAF1821985.1 hypothetical protein K489DRAFT_380732 [Dissoconium aciculare CBS 342.82]